VENLLTTGKKSGPKPNETGTTARKASPSKATLKKARDEADRILRRFAEDLAHLRVLDPACGSGNFLYVALQKLKNLEKEVSIFASQRGFGSLIAFVGPWQLYGIEINPYAHELAQMAVWIGYRQWIRFNGANEPPDPVLRPMEGNFQCLDAILDLSDPANPKEPEWPEADYIVSNPPFLGGNRIRKELGDGYVDALFALYQDRIPALADLCCYWFEKARTQVEKGRCKRAGLLATQGIRGGANREVLKRIKESGDVFWAISDKDWVLDGANVHVSLIAFDDGTDERRFLDGRMVHAINANLTCAADITSAQSIDENLDLWCYGSQQKARFDIGAETAFRMLLVPNPTACPNSDVIRPSFNAAQILRHTHETYVIDFGLQKEEASAARYEAPFEYVREHILPVRQHRRESLQQRYWWLHARPSPHYRRFLELGDRYIVTPGVSKHRVFVWKQSCHLVDHATLVFARSDDYFFGVLHCRLHEVWALKLGTRLETRPRYTPTTCFETFPLPWTPGQEPTDDPRYVAIAEAARELNQLRENHLNPPEWVKEEVLEFPGSVNGPWARYVHEPDARGIGTVRYPRLVPKDPECARKLAKRTLTNLYNERPTWLDLAHKKLDEAVVAAYGWDPAMSDEAILEKLLALNLERAAAQ
jgi:hypothetical protein